MQPRSAPSGPGSPRKCLDRWTALSRGTYRRAPGGGSRRLPRRALAMRSSFISKELGAGGGRKERCYELCTPEAGERPCSGSLSMQRRVKRGRGKGAGTDRLQAGPKCMGSGPATRAQA
ncbi:hypothetical protein NDU88_002837 [Pleurodeles waltl]|uniref:Uncharacterized protein n=1 Tax=Pleurodeles waltl TaxID=8319 RepID=A0AAV7UAE8_PLEWA|nr:hypothetical protein NDU88_002837 [Pleurodeles waltl]